MYLIATGGVLDAICGFLTFLGCTFKGENKNGHKNLRSPRLSYFELHVHASPAPLRSRGGSFTRRAVHTLRDAVATCFPKPASK